MANRTRIEVDPKIVRRLEALAAHRDTSLDEVLRAAVGWLHSRTFGGAPRMSAQQRRAYQGAYTTARRTALARGATLEQARAAGRRAGRNAAKERGPARPARRRG